MNPEAQAKLLRVASIFRRRTCVQNLLGEASRVLLSAVPADGVRYDLTDEAGKLWSRVVRAGQEPERPGFGSVAPIRSKESLSRGEEDGMHFISLPVGMGDVPAGRLVLKRRIGPFTDEEEEILRSAADLVSIALRNRPFDPPPKPRNPFEEGEQPLI